MAIGKENYFLSADGYLMPAKGSATRFEVFQSKQVLNSSGQRHDGRTVVRSSIGSIALAAVAILAVSAAQAFDASRYPDWPGQWRRPAGVGNQWDTSKPARRGQQAPLTPEYQAIYEANLKDQAAGGQGTDPPPIPVSPTACRGR